MERVPPLPLCPLPPANIDKTGKREREREFSRKGRRTKNSRETSAREATRKEEREKKRKKNRKRGENTDKRPLKRNYAGRTKKGATSRKKNIAARRAVAKNARSPEGSGR